MCGIPSLCDRYSDLPCPYSTSMNYSNDLPTELWTFITIYRFYPVLALIDCFFQISKLLGFLYIFFPSDYHRYKLDRL